MAGRLILEEINSLQLRIPNTVHDRITYKRRQSLILQAQIYFWYVVKCFQSSDLGNIKIKHSPGDKVELSVVSAVR